ncbi:MAG: hypothetical protein KA035_00595 [Candidatus Levybacteria bacterium]|nr:hypothetical protein [Candidatus Levybacteria bacterium]
MTIEQRTSYLFGIIEQEPVILKPGTSEVIFDLKGRHISFQDTVRVVDHDTLEVTTTLHLPSRIYYQDEINQANIRKTPTYLDLFTGKEVVYKWTPGVPVEEKVRERRPQTALRLQLRKA